jgi:HNH endonuclease
MTEVERFWSKVSKGENCWLWTAGRSGPYGHFALSSGIGALAHRYAWTVANGPIPTGLVVRHFVCNMPLCVRPDHLAVGTQYDNIQDKVRLGTQVHGDRHWTRQRPDDVLRGVAQSQAKLTDDDVVDIRSLVTLGARPTDIAREFKVSRRLVQLIRDRIKWAHVA